MWLAGLWPTWRPLSQRSLLTRVHLSPESSISCLSSRVLWTPGCQWKGIFTTPSYLPHPHRSWFRETVREGIDRRQMCFLPQMPRSFNCSACVMTFYGSLEMPLLTFKKVPKSNIGSFSNLTGCSSWLEILCQRICTKRTFLLCLTDGTGISLRLYLRLIVHMQESTVSGLDNRCLS